MHERQTYGPRYCPHSYPMHAAPTLMLPAKLMPVPFQRTPNKLKGT